MPIGAWGHVTGTTHPRKEGANRPIASYRQISADGQVRRCIGQDGFRNGTDAQSPSRHFMRCNGSSVGHRHDLSSRSCTNQQINAVVAGTADRIPESHFLFTYFVLV